MPTLGCQERPDLASMIGKDFDDPEWDTLLDQLTYSEMVQTITLGFHNTAAAALSARLLPRTRTALRPTAALTGGASAMCYTSEGMSWLLPSMLTSSTRSAVASARTTGHGLLRPVRPRHQYAPHRLLRPTSSTILRTRSWLAPSALLRCRHPVQGRLRLPEARRPERLRDQPPRCQHSAERAPLVIYLEVADKAITDGGYF